MATLSEILYNLRKTKGLEIKEIATKLGVSTQLYGQYEGAGTGKPKIPSINFAVKYKEAFGDNLVELLFETNVSRETINSEQLDHGPEQYPGLLYAELRELVKAAKEIALNTSSLHDAKKDIDEVIQKVNTDSGPAKGRYSKR